MTRKAYDAAEAMRVKAPPVIGGDDLFSPPTHQTSVRAHQRTVKGPPLPDGAQRKEAALAGLAEGNADVIGWLREQLTALYHDRERLRALLAESGAYVSGMSHQIAYVTADDVHRLLHDSPVWSERLSGPQFWRASVWRRQFQKIPGYHIPSLRNDQHAALLQAWRPVEK